MLDFIRNINKKSLVYNCTRIKHLKWSKDYYFDNHLEENIKLHFT